MANSSRVANNGASSPLANLLNRTPGGLARFRRTASRANLHSDLNGPSQPSRRVNNPAIVANNFERSMRNLRSYMRTRQNAVNTRHGPANYGRRLIRNSDLLN
jgi:hypothetical protein